MRLAPEEACTEIVTVAAAEAADAEVYDDAEAFDPYAFIKQLPPLSTFAPRPLMLPPRAKDAPTMTLVLDLDETLVHCTCLEEEGHDADAYFAVTVNGIEYSVYARWRPHCQQFIEALAPYYEIVIFTASHQVLPAALRAAGRWRGRYAVFTRNPRDALQDVRGQGAGLYRP